MNKFAQPQDRISFLSLFCNLFLKGSKTGIGIAMCHCDLAFLTYLLVEPESMESTRKWVLERDKSQERGRDGWMNGWMEGIFYCCINFKTFLRLDLNSFMQSVSQSVSPIFVWAAEITTMTRKNINNNMNSNNNNSQHTYNTSGYPGSSLASPYQKHTISHFWLRVTRRFLILSTNRTANCQINVDTKMCVCNSCTNWIYTRSEQSQSYLVASQQIYKIRKERIILSVGCIRPNLLWHFKRAHAIFSQFLFFSKYTLQIISENRILSIKVLILIVCFWGYDFSILYIH